LFVPKPAENQAIFSHGVHDSWQWEHGAQQAGAQPEECADGDGGGRRRPADHVKCVR